MVRVHLLLPNKPRSSERGFLFVKRTTAPLYSTVGVGEDAIVFFIVWQVSKCKPQSLGVVASLLARVHLLLPNKPRSNERGFLFISPLYTSNIFAVCSAVVNIALIIQMVVICDSAPLFKIAKILATRNFVFTHCKICATIYL